MAAGGIGASDVQPDHRGAISRGRKRNVNSCEQILLQQSRKSPLTSDADTCYNGSVLLRAILGRVSVVPSCRSFIIGKDSMRSRLSSVCYTRYSQGRFHGSDPMFSPPKQLRFQAQAADSMTCALAHRSTGEPAQGVALAAEAGLLTASALASLQGFLKVAAPCGRARLEGLSSAGLVRLDRPTVSSQGFKASPTSDYRLLATREAKAHKVPRSLEALNVLAADDLEAGVERRLRECWEVFGNVPMGSIESAAQGEDPVPQSDEIRTNRLDQIKVSAAGTNGVTGNGVRIGILGRAVDASHREYRGEHVSFPAFQLDGFPVRSSPRPNGRLGTQVAGLAVGQGGGVVPVADLAVAAMLAYGCNGILAYVFASYNRLAPHSLAPPNGFPGSCLIGNSSLGTVGYRPYLHSSAKLVRDLGRSLLIATTGNSGPRSRSVGSRGSPGRVRHWGKSRIDRFDSGREPLQRLGCARAWMLGGGSVRSQSGWLEFLAERKVQTGDRNVDDGSGRGVYGDITGSAVATCALRGPAQASSLPRSAGLSIRRGTVRRGT